MKDLELQTTTAAVHNFSSLVLSKRQLNILGHGLNFAITPSYRVSSEFFNTAVTKFESSILRKHSAVSQLYIDGLKTRLSTIPKHACRRFNLNKHDLAFILNLSARNDIIIKPADKNLGLVLMDWKDYDREVLRQLTDQTTYRELIRDNFLRNRLQAIHRKIVNIKNKFSNSFVDYGLNLSWQNIDQLSFDDCIVPQFYILPKIHKLKQGDSAASIRGRPIVPGFRWLTTKLSKWVSDRLTPLVKQYTEHMVSSTEDFIRKVDRIKVTSDCVFMTMDIESLYTNIDTKLGIKYVSEFLSDPRVIDDASLSAALIESITLILANNMFCYSDRLFLQTRGTAMGTPMAPNYANIFVFMLEKDIIESFFDNTLIRLYYRYLDDLFLVCRNNPDLLDKFISSLDSLSTRGIKYTRQISHESAVFLDVEIFKGKELHTNSKLDTKLYQKPLNLYLYIPFNSFHLPLVKKNMILNELKRYIKCCSQKEDYIIIKKRFYHRLRARGYPAHHLIPLFNSVRYKDRVSYLYTTNRIRKRDVTRFIIDNHPSISQADLYSILNKGWPSGESPISITFKRPKALKDILCVNRIRSSSTELDSGSVHNDIKRRRLNEIE